MIVGMLAILASCTDGSVDDTPSVEQDKNVNVNFTISIPEFEKGTRSITFNNEGIDNAGDVYLFCFDNNGQFVGLGKITKFENVTLNDIRDDGSTEEKKITAELPTATSRLHFVANANKQYQTINMSSQKSWVGMHENTLMTAFETVSGEEQTQKVRYWGYVKRDNPKDLQDYLNKESDDHILHLVRDRAKVSAEFKDKSKNNDITISVINSQSYGTLAPFDSNNLVFPTTTGDENWTWNIDYVTPSLSGGNIKGDKGQMSNPAYCFENRNSPTDPMKVIINTKGKNYLIYLQDSLNVPYMVKRNYEYKIIIDKLDERLGYSDGDLERCRKGAPINNPWIKVEEVVPGVSDGKQSLSIIGGTYKMLNEGSGEQTVQFKYEGESMTAEDFNVSWIKNEQYAEKEKLDLSYDNSTGIGTITYTLMPIDKNLREGIIHIIDKKHGLNRNIHLYSIKDFDYGFKFTKTNNTSDGTIGTLTFKIPSIYPDGFMPWELKIASADIVPEGSQVKVESTKDIPGGESWNCWYATQYDATYKDKEVTIKLKKAANSTAANGKFYIKAPSFNGGKPFKMEY